MALWPFRRRSGRKRPRSGTAQSDAEGGPPISPTEVARASSKKKRRTEPPRPLQPTRTYSFEPGQQDSLPVDRERALLRKRDRKTRGNKSPVQDELANNASDRTPTLHPDNKSSKKRRDRKEKRAREAQIKAMVDFEPVRPAAEQWTSGRSIKRETYRGGSTPFGRHRSTRNSDVSLPSPGSIHSSLSSDSEMGAFTVSPLDALAPRPTLRYTRGPRCSPPPQLAPIQSSTQKRRLVVKEPIPEETMRAHKRIDSLADDLDASDLRELMERDKRRREKKKQKDRARMERRLTQRAEEQRAEEVESRKTGTPPPENLERGVLGRELVGLGIEPASAVVTSSKQRDSSESSGVPSVVDETTKESPKKPSQVFRRSDSISVEDQPAEEKPPKRKSYERKSLERRSSGRQSSEQKSERQSVEQKSTEQKPAEQRPVEEQPTPMEIDTPRDGSFTTRPSEDHPPSIYSTRLAGILRSVKSRSRSTLRSERDKMVSPPPDTIHEEPTRKDSHDSGSSNKGAHFNLRSLFRFGSKRQRRLVEEEEQQQQQSSFSNTSREEMQAVAAAVRAKAQAQAQALARLEGEDFPVYIARKNSVPKRTRSRFREDLPELPLSPPASPEPEPPVPPLPEAKTKEVEQAAGHRTAEGVRRTPTLERGYASPSPEAQMSVSLASIDSEGSWLSGKKDARRMAMRNSLRRANRRDQGISDTPTNSTGEDVAEDEYLSKFTPRRTPSKKETGSDEDVDMKWGSVGNNPHVVNRTTMKSQEGLLDIDSENDSESPVSPVSPASEIADVQRARSINLGKGHVRNFSAGSAKLLEISPRLSSDRRHSVERK